MDFRDPHHLPSRGESDPNELPRQRKGTTPQMHGRYPDYDVLAEAPHWDAVTRRVVLDRVANPPAITFFSEDEARVLRPFLDVLLAQDAEPRIPVLEMVDAKLAAGKLDGFQYDDMPDDRDTWRLVAAGLDETARGRGGASYAEADEQQRLEIIDAFAAGELDGGSWDRLNTSRAWSVVTRSMLAAFYAHPWAWNEIGFGGPAYPRGYARMGIGLSEAWEAPEALHLDPVEDVKRRGLE